MTSSSPVPRKVSNKFPLLINHQRLTHLERVYLSCRFHLWYYVWMNIFLLLRIVGRILILTRTQKEKKTIKQPAVFLNGRAVSAVAASGRTRRICECFHDWEAENRIWIKLQEKSWANVYCPSVRTWVQIPGTYTKLVEAAVITGSYSKIGGGEREKSPQELKGRKSWLHYREQQDLPGPK